ncbi:hypothetical protein LOK49_LG01G01680 [Camellia lanceoleosa]|uniref:Uncharacterized protein n=1 Tax=Camellia lanceoleosa TaxID=1840588 RepID=A0ACC0J0Y6_9ERIC|nr:hypothetical protein LOK49_LG01G01680 [Camellia lanceoleosa]
MTGLDAKKQTAEVKDVLDLARCNAADIKALNEIVMAISSKMNIPVSVSPHVALGSPSPPPPSPISNRGGGNGEGDDNAILWRNGIAEKQKRRKKWEVFEANMKEKVASGHQETLNQTEMGFKTVSKLLLIQGAQESLLRGEGNLYSVRDKPMPEAMVELWRGLTGLDAKKQTAEVKDVLDLARCNVVEMKTLNEIVTAISSKMNITVLFSPHVAPGSPSRHHLHLHLHLHIHLHRSLIVEEVMAEEVMVVTVISDSSKVDFSFL